MKVKKTTAKGVRQFKSYNTLCERLRDLGLKKSGRLTSFLFKTFVLGDGKIYSDKVREADLLEPTEIFKVWRRRMCAMNILVYELNKVDPKQSKYYPGHKIVDLINKERLSKYPVASEKYINNELQNIKSELSLQKALINKIIKKINPPVTEDKYKQYVENPDLILDKLEENKIELDDNEDEIIEPDFDFGD